MRQLYLYSSLIFNKHQIRNIEYIYKRIFTLQYKNIVNKILKILTSNILHNYIYNKHKLLINKLKSIEKNLNNYNYKYIKIY